MCMIKTYDYKRKTVKVTGLILTLPLKMYETPVSIT